MHEPHETPPRYTQIRFHFTPSQTGHKNNSQIGNTNISTYAYNKLNFSKNFVKVLKITDKRKQDKGDE
jgi:hypothetical protein